MLPKITSAMLVVTHACNLACRYCFVHQEPCHMSFEAALDAAKFLAVNAEESGQTPSVNFFGGEPMLMWDSIIVPLTEWIRKEYGKPFQLSVTTNGTLLTPERITYMKENHIGMLLSIDGREETQNYNRPYHSGEGSFETLSQTLPLVVENFPGTTFRMTAIPKTCGNTYENIRFAEASGFKSFFIMPNVFESWDTEARAALKGEISKYGEYYMECMRSGADPIRFSTFESAFSDIKAINNAVTRNEHRAGNRGKACGKCGLGASRFASIHPNGNVYGCQEMTSNEGEKSIFYIGSIYTGIEEERRTALMELFDREDHTGDACAKCRYNRICDGGCVANNYLLTGSLNKVPEVYCWWKRVVLNEAIRVMQTLGNEGNAMFRSRWAAIQ